MNRLFRFAIVVFRIAKNACLMKRRESAFAPSQELSLDDFFRGRMIRVNTASFRSPIGLRCRMINCYGRK